MTNQLFEWLMPLPTLVRKQNTPSGSFSSNLLARPIRLSEWSKGSFNGGWGGRCSLSVGGILSYWSNRSTPCPTYLQSSHTENKPLGICIGSVTKVDLFFTVLTLILRLCVVVSRRKP